MDQNGGGGMGGMADMDAMGSMADIDAMGGMGNFNMSSDDLQHVGMDANMMNLDMNLEAMSPEYTNMMDPTDKSQQHRQSQSQQYQSQKMNLLMPGFGNGPPNDLDGFQFDPSTSLPAGMSPSFVSSPAISTGTPASVPNGGIAKRRMDKQRAQQQRRASSGNIALNTDFGNLNTGMMSASASPIHPMTAMGVPMNMENYPFTAMNMPIEVNLGMAHSAEMNNQHHMHSHMGGSHMGANMFGAPSMTGMPLGQSMGPPAPVRRQSFPILPHHQQQQHHHQHQHQHQHQHHQQPQRHQQQRHNSSSQVEKNGLNQGGDGNGRMISSDEQMLMHKTPHMNMSDAYMQAQMLSRITPEMAQNAMGEMNMISSTPRSSSAFSHEQPPLHDQNFMSYDTNQQRDMNSFSTGNTNLPGGPGGETLPGQNSIPQYLNAYSATGFDMLTVLMKVATRSRPRINIGAVDMSCAFVVCDVNQHDVPIVYCSDMFERLTGYTKHEILGRNCRFLQAPDGRVESGVKRKYVDDRAVLHLKNMINQRQEAQISLINYRKGGQPFMNLLTMIPISWDTDEIRYYVGFQVDLVEQPGAVTNKNPDGTYQINYQRNELEPYQVPMKNPADREAELDRSIGSDEVSTVLANIGQNESEISRRIWDKVLLENTDDVVHVLSLKGLFLYLSPSCRRVLEYDPHELVGTALSSVCHPSDIVPVTRELKDTSSGANVNVVFRIRRKNSGYTWFEAHGTLHLEQGKAKKCIILVGRERPVYALLRNNIIGGFGEQELWTKMSTTGMFLYVSHNVKQLLDRLPEDLVGTSAQNLMRQESKVMFGQALEVARTGARHTFKHDVQNKRGQTLHAETTFYPGDADEGKKPTFLVAQTRLIKMSRGHPSLLKQSSSTSERSQGFIASADSQSPHTASTAASGGNYASRPTPQSLMGHTTRNGMNNGVMTAAGGHSLSLGNQDEALAADDNVFDELKTTRSTSWQFELRQMEKRNRLLAEELQSLLSNKKKRKRRKGLGQLQKDCANCHTRNTPEWRRGPSGQRDLCNSCGLRWAKQQGRVSPRTSSQHSGDKHSSASSPRASINGEKTIAAGSQGSPASHQQSPVTTQHAMSMSLSNGDKAIKMEMPNQNRDPGPAAMGERMVPQTIQEGIEPTDEES